MDVFQIARDNPAMFTVIAAVLLWLVKSAFGPWTSRIPCKIADVFQRSSHRAGFLFDLHDWYWYRVDDESKGRVTGSDYMLKGVMGLATCRRCGRHLLKDAT